MAYMEAAIVVYLRQAYYPEHVLVIFPPRMLSEVDMAVELGREVATLVMILAVAVLVARRLVDVLAAFFYVFGIWDIFILRLAEGDHRLAGLLERVGCAVSDAVGVGGSLAHCGCHCPALCPLGRGGTRQRTYLPLHCTRRHHLPKRYATHGRRIPAARRALPFRWDGGLRRVSSRRLLVAALSGRLRPDGAGVIYGPAYR